MKILLDTHIFLWLQFNPEKLSSKIIDNYQNTINEIFLSYGSIWEMQIKLQLGKLEFSIDLDEVIEKQLNNGYIKLLPIQLNHILRLKHIPFHHKDPFDRIIISQAICENLIIATTDSFFNSYLVKLL